MATLFDGISQRLDFKREEGGSSSDNSSDDYISRIGSPKIASPRIRSPRYGSPSSACRTPRTQRHRSRSRTISSPLQCVSPIPYASWKKLRLCDSPSTPKVRTPSIHSVPNNPWDGLQISPHCPHPNVTLNVNKTNTCFVRLPPPEPALQVVPTFLYN